MLQLDADREFIVYPSWADLPYTWERLPGLLWNPRKSGFLADGYYITAVKPWDGKAAKDPAVKATIAEGVARLDQNAGDRHKVSYAEVAWEADRVALLQGIEHSDFFQKVRGDLIVSLYNQKEVWPKFGYEGSSAEHGGYINRGFADIDWLPKA